MAEFLLLKENEQTTLCFPAIINLLSRKFTGVSNLAATVQAMKLITGLQKY